MNVAIIIKTTFGIITYLIYMSPSSNYDDVPTLNIYQAFIIC